MPVLPSQTSTDGKAELSAPPVAEAEPSMEQIEGGMADLKANASPWGKVKKAQEAGSTALNIEEQEERLRDLLTAVSATMETASKELMTSAKIPVASFGRVKDVVDKLKAQQVETIALAWKAEQTELRTAAAEKLDAVQSEVGSVFQKQFADMERKLKAERDQQIEEANKELKQLRKDHKELKDRSEGSEDLLAKGELAVNAEKAKVEVLEVQVKKLEENVVRNKEAWAAALSEILASCTLEPDKQEEKVQDNSRMWRAKQKTTAELLRSEVDKCKTAEDQLRCMMTKYEDAKVVAEELLVVERKAIIEEHKKQAQAEERFKVELKAVEDKVSEVQKLLEAEEARSLGFQNQLTSIHKTAKQEARDETKEIETELNEKVVAIETELNEKSVALEKVTAKLTETQKQFTTYVESSGLLLHREQAKLATAVAHLKSAQAAQKNGGYYFAAAPAKPDLRIQAPGDFGEDDDERRYPHPSIPGSPFYGRSPISSPDGSPNRFARGSRWPRGQSPVEERLRRSIDSPIDETMQTTSTPQRLRRSKRRPVQKRTNSPRESHRGALAGETSDRVRV